MGYYPHIRTAHVPPTYETPENFTCPSCNHLCKIIPLENEFDYSGTHCTGGKSGTEYPSSWGNPVTDCCETLCADEMLDAFDPHSAWTPADEAEQRHYEAQREDRT